MRADLWRAASCVALVLAALVPSWAPVASGTHGSGWDDEQAAVAAWVKGLQYVDPAQPASLGALRVHTDPGAVVPPGTGYWHVIPYDANRAVSGLLRSDDPDRLDAAERWILWYLAHLHKNPPGVANPAVPDGVVFDHWYLADGSGETTCVPALGVGGCLYRDADDSTASTFLALLWAYAEEGGPRAAAFLDAPGRRAQVEEVAGVVLALMDADNLTVARPDWRYKYLMDNSETYCGLRAMAVLEATRYGDAARGSFYAGKADASRAAIFARLYDPAAGAYRQHVDPADRHADRDLSTWYPGSVSTVWPALHNVTAGDDPVALAQVAAIDAAWDGRPGHPDWTRAYVNKGVAEANLTWPAMGHAALLAGDAARAQAHTEFVKAEKIDRGFPAHFSGGEAGWLLLTLAAGVEPPGRSLMCP